MQLKWMDITDIIYWTDMSGERVWHDTAVPDSEQLTQGLDPLAELIKLATPEGINVWAAWHSCTRSKPSRKILRARCQRRVYKYGSLYYVEDLLNPPGSTATK